MARASFGSTIDGRSGLALVYVGIGRQPPQWAGEVLAGRDRALAAPTFAACGLYLTRVEYDRTLELPTGADVEFGCAP